MHDLVDLAIGCAFIREVAFLGNDNVIVTTNRDAALINLSTNKQDFLVPTTDDIYGRLAYTITTNLDKTKVIISNRDNHIIYDTETNKKYIAQLPLHFENEGKPLFTDCNDTTIIEGDDQQCFSHNYVTNTYGTHTMCDIIKSSQYFNDFSGSYQSISAKAYHPIKKECTLVPSGEQKISIYDVLKNELLSTIKLKEFPRCIKYSPDGSLLDLNSINGNGSYIISVIDTNTGTVTQLETSHCILASDFHPSNDFLVTCSKTFYIQYWNTKTFKCFFEQPLRPIDDYQVRDLSNNSHISFSADGTLLAVAMPGMCAILNVPFEVIAQKTYPLKTKEKMIALLWLLKAYQHDNQPLLPEIIQLLMHTTLKISEL